MLVVFAEQCCANIDFYTHKFNIVCLYATSFRINLSKYTRSTRTRYDIIYSCVSFVCLTYYCPTAPTHVIPSSPPRLCHLKACPVVRVRLRSSLPQTRSSCHVSSNKAAAMIIHACMHKIAHVGKRWAELKQPRDNVAL